MSWDRLLELIELLRYLSDDIIDRDMSMEFERVIIVDEWSKRMWG
jgi:hypothetical protein